MNPVLKAPDCIARFLNDGYDFFSCCTQPLRGFDMKTLFLAGVSAVAIASLAPAHAADLPMKAPVAAVEYFSWTGLYVGVHAGWGQSKLSDTQGYLPSGAPTSYNTGFNTNVSGNLFGGQLGYNYAFSPAWLVGIEGSVSGPGMNGFDYTVPYQNCCFMWSKVDVLSSVTGRLGWSGFDPRAMVYAKGGAAWVRDEFMFSYALNARQTRTGWTVGAGYEFAPAIMKNWSFFAEYDYYGFGNKNVPNCNNNNGICSSVDVRQNIQTVKVGANYKFNLGRM
jgi:outer membrane immunogenic protein